MTPEALEELYQKADRLAATHQLEQNRLLRRMQLLGEGVAIVIGIILVAVCTLLICSVYH